MLRLGLLLGFTAVFLQIAVFLQPLLPKQYQIAPVCETITQLLASTQKLDQSLQYATQHNHQSMSHDQQMVHHVKSDHQHSEKNNADRKLFSATFSTQTHSGHDHHDPSHQCQYCTVYGHLVLPPELSVDEILTKIQVRLIALQKAFKHIYFVLQRLYLLPQGRAPPIFA